MEEFKLRNDKGLKPNLWCNSCGFSELEFGSNTYKCLECSTEINTIYDVPSFLEFRTKEEENSFNYWDGGIPGTVDGGYQHGKVSAKYPEKDWFLEGDTVRYSQYPRLARFCEFEKFKDKMVLDIGPGRGQETLHFANHGAKVTALDYASQGVKLVKERIKQFDLNASLVQGDATALPFKSNSFDLVFSYGVLHHIPEMQKSIDEVFRVLKPGASAKIMVYHKGLFYYKDMFLKWYLLKGNFLKHTWKEYIKIAMEQKAGKCPVVYIGSMKTILKQFENFEVESYFNDEIIESRLIRWNIIPRSFIQKFSNLLGAYCHINLRKPLK